MKVCLTGSTGFIGQGLSSKLEDNGFDVLMLTREYKPNTSKKRYFIANLTDDNVLLDGFLDDASVIYHCAGEIKDTKLMYELHVNGTKRLLQAVDKQIKGTQKPIHWVQLSSVGAYGSASGLANEHRIVTELTECNPIGEYEVTKTIADELVKELAATQPLFSYTILRPSNVIGPSMPNQSLRSLVQIIKKRLFFYIGSRTSVATYIHVDDVVDTLILCGTDLRARGQVFNLSNDCNLSEIVSAVAKTSGIKPPTLCLPEKPLRFLVKNLSPIKNIPLTEQRIDALVRKTHYPSKKIKDLLGFVPQRNIPKSVPLIFNLEQNEN